MLIPLRRNDPVVSLIDAAMTTHRLVRELARYLLRFVRGR
jgi:hypothetical protein